MLHRDILIPHRLGLILRIHQCLVQLLAEIQLTALHLRSFLQCGADTIQKVFLVDLHLLYQLQDQAVLQGKQTVQQMLLLDLLVAVFVSQTLTTLNRLNGLLCKFLDIHTHYPLCFFVL